MTRLDSNHYENLRDLSEKFLNQLDSGQSAVVTSNGAHKTSLYPTCSLFNHSSLELTSIYFGHMESLEIADLADHGGIQINHDTFQHLPSLRRLVLRNCSLDGSTPALIDQLTVPHEISQRNCNTTAANTLRWYNPLLREIDFSENPGLYILPKQIYFPPTLLFLNLRKTNIPIFDSDFTRFSLGVR